MCFATYLLPRAPALASRVLQNRPSADGSAHPPCSHVTSSRQTNIIADGFRSLAEGEPVEFVVEDNDGRTKAVEVTGPGGANPQVLTLSLFPCVMLLAAPSIAVHISLCTHAGAWLPGVSHTQSTLFTRASRPLCGHSVTGCPVSPAQQLRRRRRRPAEQQLYVIFAHVCARRDAAAAICSC